MKEGKPNLGSSDTLDTLTREGRIEERKELVVRAICTLLSEGEWDNFIEDEHPEREDLVEFFHAFAPDMARSAAAVKQVIGAFAQNLSEQAESLIELSNTLRVEKEDRGVIDLSEEDVKSLEFETRCVSGKYWVEGTLDGEKLGPLSVSLGKHGNVICCDDHGRIQCRVSKNFSLYVAALEEFFRNSPEFYTLTYQRLNNVTKGCMDTCCER